MARATFRVFPSFLPTTTTNSGSLVDDDMIQTGLIQSAHADLVTDAAYDFYGLRLATCSLDQRLAESRCTISFPYPFFAE